MINFDKRFYQLLRKFGYSTQIEATSSTGFNFIFHPKTIFILKNSHTITSFRNNYIIGYTRHFPENLMIKEMNGVNGFRTVGIFCSYEDLFEALSAIYINKKFIMPWSGERFSEKYFKNIRVNPIDYD